MILYFSGTGNSAFVARKIAKDLQDEYMNLFDRIRNKEYGEIHSNKPFIVVCPTYGWRIPHFLEEWMEQVTFSGNQEMYFVLTCGSDIGNAGSYAKAFCERKGLRYRGCGEIVMPENYIAMFPVPDREESEIIIEKAIPRIEKLVYYIQVGRPFPKTKDGPISWLKSAPVNKAFYSLFVHAKKFTVKDSCIGCGKCERVCPLQNIRLENGRPVWGKECTHCMACICKCPKEAIEYGSASEGKPRYTCPR